MIPFWVVLWTVLPPPALLSGPDRCTVHGSSGLHHESLLLKSLQCHNDYESYVHCKWREHRRTPLQLWFKTISRNTQCMPYTPAVQEASEDNTFQCRFKTRALSIGIKHTVFFLNPNAPTVCSWAPQEPLDLSQRLRTRPPVNLSAHDTGDGGWRLSWSSPYPASSTLNNHITYELSYRADSQDSWTTDLTTNTSMKLEKRLLLPGRRYEARTRAQASLGQWSSWSPVVTWHTEENTGQFPSLHCVLDGEKEVVCSWKVSTELADFITYQLACRHNRTAPSEWCCANPTVSSDHSSKVQKYSCSLTDADPARLLLELLPTRTAKTFEANQHIRPNPPQQVKVREEGSNWRVSWVEPSTALKLNLYYQVSYSMQGHGPSIQLNTSAGSKSLTILGVSLVPSQRYQVKIQSLVVPGKDFIYGGVPSEWTDPVEWTSHEATWSPYLIYFSISVFMATVFLILYCTIPACQRRVILWVDSVPSPGKSKILSEIKSTTSRSLMPSESTSICKVYSDRASTRCSVVLLCPTKEAEIKKHFEQDEGCWSCNNLPSPAETVNSSVTSSMSFSGPYIFCQSSEHGSKPVDVKCDETEREKGKDTPSDDSASPSPLNLILYGEGYVRLPSCNVSRSTQDLVSHSDANTSTQQQQQALDPSLWPEKMDVQPGLSEPISSHQPSAYASGHFIPWPQGGATQSSGYCHIPTAPTRAAIMLS